MSLEKILEFTGQRNDIYCTDISKDKSMVAYGDNNGSFRVIDINTGNNVLFINEGDNSIDGVRFSPDNTKIYAVSTSGRSLYSYDLETGEQIFKNTDFNYDSTKKGGFDISDSGSLVAIGTDNGHLSVVDTSTFEEVFTANTGGMNIKSIDFYDEENSLLFLAGDNSDYVSIYNYDYDSENYRFDSLSDSDFRFCKLSADKTKFVAGTENGTAYIVETEGDRNILYTFSNHNEETSPVYSGAILPGYDQGITGGTYLRHWDGPTQEEIYKENYPSNVIQSITTSDDGDIIFVCDGNGTARVYSTDIVVSARLATNLNYNGMTLNGKLHSIGDHEEVECYFEYTEDPNFDTGVNTTTKTSLTTAGEFDVYVDGLTPDVQYYYRAVADPVDTTTTSE